MILLSLALAADVSTRDITPCTGEPLPEAAEVTVHYSGRVQGADAPFDDTRSRERPFTVKLGMGQLIEGWEKGMQGMTIGCRREITVPPELGYGAEGRPPVIPAGSTLIFDIEVLSAKAPRRPPAAPSPVPSYTTTESGLQFHDLVVGEGPQPEPNQLATVEYTLWLPDGTLVDSSFNRPGPFSYRVDRGAVIKGWEEGVRGMRVGGTRQLRVPWALGYGVRGSPPRIPAKTDLVFEVRLINVE